MIIPAHRFFKYSQLFFFLSIVMILFSCEEDDNSVYTLSWENSSTISYATRQNVLHIYGAPGASWVAKIADGQDWCSFNSKSDLYSIEGFVVDGTNTITLYTKVNSGGTNREARIEILFEGKGKIPQEISLSQAPSFNGFTETPAMVEDDNYRYVTHFTNLNNKTIRNYSICYDVTKKAALWVAYPIHAIYLQKNTGRTDDWAFDPEIDEADQANCVNRSYSGSYDRGHQIASGDRTGSKHMNQQTFYMSNMTPQWNRLNQDMWANLEAKVRTYSCSDTLFVVTGAYFEPGNNETVRDGGGVAVAKPTHYYKVILRTTSGRTGKYIGDCRDDELKSIGFWVEHRSYGNIEPPTSIIRSVEDIEALTGFEFFPLVSKEVKRQNRPGDWGL